MMSFLHRKVRTQNALRGITLVESIIIVSIFTILIAVISSSIASFYKFNGYTLAQSYQITHARRGIEVLVRDIREMTFADDGTFPLAIMEEHRIGFYSDIDKDNSVEYVEYELATNTLEKRIYNATGTPPFYDLSSADQVFILSQYVQNELMGTTTFVYYDDTGAPATPTSTVTDIRYIEAQIIVNIDPLRDPGQFMLRSSAALRNLRNNI